MPTVRVRPSGDWWLVEADGLAAPMVFASGAQAESTAQQLALAWSGAVGATLEVECRSGAGYRFICVPKDQGGASRFVAVP